MNGCDALIVFPHQLFRGNAAFRPLVKQVFLVQDSLFFHQYRFHCQKLVLHRASMKMHADYLDAAGFKVEYIDEQEKCRHDSLVRHIKGLGFARLHYIDPVDDWLERRLLKAATDGALILIRHDTPMFLSTRADLSSHFTGVQRPRMAHFYTQQRKERNVLMQEGGPMGGRWSFDSDNRKKLRPSVKIPYLAKPAPNPFVSEAVEYVASNFPDALGQLDGLSLPVTYEDADRWLESFCEERLAGFGDYEDAMSTDEPVLFHSVLSPLLNIGLLTPDEVLEAALKRRGSVPLNSLEGFVRQVLGWREYVRGAYEFLGREQRTRNFWSHTRALPKSFYDATTGIGPVDTVIRRVIQGAYAHHIERLMVLGCFTLLCEFEPNAVYRWFMEMFIDAYDWVMVPNVYGMALYADGGAITTKPYLCGSNYLLRMSDFQAGPWCQIWDGLYWRFISKHRLILEANPRTQMTIRSLDRMAASKREALFGSAERFLSGLK